MDGNLNIIGTMVLDDEEDEDEAMVGTTLSSYAGSGGCTLLIIRCNMVVNAILSFPVNFTTHSSIWEDNISICSYKSICVFFKPYSR